MSKIIKAAELKVLIPNETQTVIPTLGEGDNKQGASQGAVLESTNLLQNARQEADEIIKDAKVQAAKLLEKAEEQEETIRLRAKELGFEEGYQEGLVEGREVGLKQLKEHLELVETTIEEAVQLRARSLGALEDDFLKFSLLLADKILKKQVQKDISWLDPTIKDALHALGHVQEIIIRLNSADLLLLTNLEEDLQLNSRGKLRFEEDPSIEQGGCLIESESGLIDARLEQRLKKLANHLLEVLYDDGH